MSEIINDINSALNNFFDRDRNDTTQYNAHAYLMWFLDRVASSNSNERYQLDVIVINNNGKDATFHYRYWFIKGGSWDVELVVCPKNWEDVKGYIEKESIV